LRTKAVITNWLHQYKKDGINGLQPKKGKHRLLKQPKQIEPEQAKIDKSKTQDELLEEIASGKVSFFYPENEKNS
jgi:transposase